MISDHDPDNLHMHVANRAASVAELLIGEALDDLDSAALSALPGLTRRLADEGLRFDPRRLDATGIDLLRRATAFLEDAHDHRPMRSTAAPWQRRADRMAAASPGTARRDRS